MRATLVLAANTGDSACQPANIKGACDVDTRGIRVEPGGQWVTDVVTATCHHPYPQSHRIEAWLEYRPGRGPGEFRRPSFPKYSNRIPHEDGVSLTVVLPCRPGDYRAAWRTIGVGELGRGFDLEDRDFFPTPIGADECAR